MRKNKNTHFMAGVLIILFSVLFVILAGRFMYIQATGEVQGVSLEEFADQKRTAAYSLESERGKIYDNNGMTLAYDMPVYRIYAIVDEAYSEGLDEPKHVVDPNATAEALAPYLGLEANEIQDKLESGIAEGRFQVEFGNAGKDLSKQTRDEILELNLPGINFEEDSLRYYPNAMFASQIIGFAQETETEVEGEIVREINGIAGIEKEMNEILKGQNGYISYQRDKYNNRLLDPNEVVREPQDGDDVYLTIDQKIQTLVEDVLTQVQKEYNPKRLTAVVMNPKTGEVLAMGNRPSYNPNNPENVENWYNDVISSPFELGSTVKMITWAAAIEEGVYNGNEKYQSGTYQANEAINPVRDYNSGRGFGVISYDEGFARSSNVASAKLVWEKLGTEKFLEYLQAFDLDKKTGIDLPGEVAGQILYNWPLEKITTSFGQGSTFTPIQLVKAATAVANDGKMVKPYVIDKIVDSSTGKVIEENKPEEVGQPISKETADHMLKLLDSVVNSEVGSGKKFKLEDYTAGGKSGTAEIPNPNGGGYLTGRENYVFSFLGMAPIEDPQLIMYVAVKQPELESSQVGSDPVSFIFKNVMENSLHYLNINPDKEPKEETNLLKVPELIGKNAISTQEELIKNGAKVTLIGNGEKITASNIQAGEEILSQERIILITDKPSMPNILGWSMREVMQLADLMNLQIETFGNGYVTTQSVQEGANLQEGDYLGVELQPPNSNDQDTETEEGTEQES
ncbi:penicillin-binding protein [Oceanobacillus piezotolerans]|uniref:serine-type D-Ala-D-Ala carboxypeptidase n=1 Tax=Oceanobacillus piezotolerans TaxID=2448030 RepID=A0A498DNC5_9BACI|nr:penicillin-binding protein [Oceanobacillus piezotolerans]RLL45232.1 penicillin-binding protein [Oceanobacillus piezotolerans]